MSPPITYTIDSYAGRRVLTSKPAVSPKVWTAESSPKIEELFASIRDYARQQQISVLELIADHALDDLPMGIAQTIREYLAERSPKVEPGQVEYRSFFASGRPDISERMEEIIYGPKPSDDE